MTGVETKRASLRHFFTALAVGEDGQTPFGTPQRRFRLARECARNWPLSGDAGSNIITLLGTAPLTSDTVDSIAINPFLVAWLLARITSHQNAYMLSMSPVASYEDRHLLRRHLHCRPRVGATSGS
jgi:hypothetical protein